MKKLNILHLQFSSKSAGSSALRLHKGFLDHTTHNSSILSLVKDDSIEKNIFYLPKKARIYAKVNNKIEAIFHNYDKSKFGLYSSPIIGYPVNNHPLVKQADIIYVHWVMMGFFSLETFEALIATRKIIIVFMHDMWYLTGGCHYAIECNLFLSICSKCPIFPSNKNVALHQFINKDYIFKSNKNLFFVSPSIWLKKLGEESSLLSRKPIFYIPNYFKSQTYIPRDKSKIRNELRLPVNKRIVCFGAVSVNSPYKGWNYLKMSLQCLLKFFTVDELEVLVFGELTLDQITNDIPYKINTLGYLHNENDLSNAYNAADVFVLPSTIDNQPTTVIESLNCGTPVVVFELGGSPEMIDHKKNGYISKPYDFEDFALGILFCLSNELNVGVKENYLPNNVISSHEKLLTGIQDENYF